jgi:phospholipid/cholesterol/gamma-HCH transport system substrate-binding protein
VIKTTPSPRQLAVIVLFALSTFGLLLYLWLSFGGASPLAPQGYRFNVDFRQSSQLAEQADVRISGVPVGKVVKVELGPDNSTRALLQLDEKYAPAHVDMRAILRTKTLLGETYVELTPGTDSARRVPENGTLPQTQVGSSVALDEIFRAFDPKTRTAFQNWMQGMAAGLHGRGKDLSNAWGNLVPFADNADELLTIMDAQSADVRKAISGTATVFDALSHRSDQLRTLITAGDTTFGAIGASSRALARTFQVLPGFERQSRTTLHQLDAFADEASPLLDALQPAIKQMTPTFQTLEKVSPDLQTSLEGLNALAVASKQGFPALVSITGELQSLFAGLTPPLRHLTPLLQWVGGHQPELQAFIANFTAASEQGELPDVNAPASTPIRRYIRIATPVNQLSLAGYQQRPGANRANAYPKAGSQGDPGNLSVFSAANCGNANPVITGAPTPEQPAVVVDLLTALGITEQGSEGQSAAVPAPVCVAQGPFDWNGTASSFPHLTEAPVAR